MDDRLAYAERLAEDVLRQLCSGQLSSADLAAFGDPSFHSLVSEMGKSFPMRFQQRSVGRNQELGLARAVRFEFAGRRTGNWPLRLLCWVPLLVRCVFIRAQEDLVKEIMVTVSIRIKLARRSAHEPVLRMGRGFKLTRVPDGWAFEEFKRRRAWLSERLLRERGWKLDALVPLLAKAPQ